MRIQELNVEWVERFRGIRLRALRDAPTAFGTTFEDAEKWPTEEWVGLLSSMTVFVAAVGGVDVGVVRVGPDRGFESRARLGSLWVAPEFRGTHVGRSLIDVVVEWARSRGYAELVLGVSDDNDSAIALYSRCGFEPTGEVATLPPPREHLSKHMRRLRLS